MIEIVEVKSRKQLKAFINFPIELYKGNPYYVPPLIFDEINTLDRTKNPAFSYCDAKYWIAYKDGKIAGTIAGIINKLSIERDGEKKARFSWVDFIDDKEVSKALFDRVETWAKSQGLSYVNGPLGFCDMDKKGLLIEGFEEMGTIITFYHYPYYKEHIEALGYSKEVDMFEMRIDLTKGHNPRLERISEKILKRYDIKLVVLKKPKDALKYVNEMFELLNKEYDDLHEFTPLNDEQIKTYVKQYFSFVNPDYITFVMDKDDKMIGFGVVMPSLSEAVRKSNGRLLPFGFVPILKAIKKNTCLDLYLVAIRRDYHRKGIANVILNHLTKVAEKNGVTTAIASPQLETNKKVLSMWRDYDYKIHRKRRIYKKKIT